MWKLKGPACSRKTGGCPRLSTQVLNSRTETETLLPPSSSPYNCHLEAVLQPVPQPAQDHPRPARRSRIWQASNTLWQPPWSQALARSLTLHTLCTPPADPRRPLGGSVAPNLAGRRHFPRPAERPEDARVLGILDAPGTRRPPPPAQPRGSRAAQPARCGLAAASLPTLPAPGTSREKAGFAFLFFFFRG